MILPKRLQKGDTVGVIAPASPPNLENLEKAIPFLENLGLQVKVGPNVSKTYGYLAGTDQERLDDLHAMFTDSDVSGIICAGGGYGTGRIVSSINFDLIKSNPKTFWGYSDITYLHTAIRQKTGLVTFHGPMLSSDVGKDSFEERSRAMFQQLFQPETLQYTESFSPLQTISDGEAEGELVGGNLSLLVNTMGSPYELDTKGKLLLIEDIGEEPYRVDSFLSQLKLAGKLKEAAGIVVGDFSEAEPKKRDQSLTLEDVYDYYFSRLNKPVVSGFKIGHCQPHFAVPLGAKATLSSSSKTLTIEPGVQ
ncbi:S66 peptidase family protein [Halobacillus mangrovi]|uniref:S66 peptidase family protein n=1 Tax=Halobacillus mangrovi TaxID=402384 RepID=UPI003D99433D